MERLHGNKQKEEKDSKGSTSLTFINSLGPLPPQVTFDLRKVAICFFRDWNWRLEFLQRPLSHTHTSMITCVKCLAFNLSCSFGARHRSVVMEPNWAPFRMSSFAPTSLSLAQNPSSHLVSVTASLWNVFFFFFLQMRPSHFSQGTDSIAKPETTTPISIHLNSPV